MRDNDCAGYKPPTVATLSRMIAHGRIVDAAMVLDMLGHTIKPDDSITAAVASASGRGHTEAVKFAIRHGLCTDATPILVGAAAAGRTDMIDWSIDPTNTLVSALAIPPSAIRVDTIMAAAVSADRPDAITWITKHLGRPSPSLMWIAISAGAARAAHALDAMLTSPFNWRAAVDAILRSGSFALLRYAVEEKGAVIEPWAFCAAVDRGLPTETLVYLSYCLSDDQLQLLVDMLGACTSDMPNRSAMALVCETAGNQVCRSVAEAVASITDKRVPGWAEQCECSVCHTAPRVSASIQIAAALRSHSSAKRCHDASRATDAADDGCRTGDAGGQHVLPHKRPKYGETAPIAPGVSRQVVPFS